MSYTIIVGNAVPKQEKSFLPRLVSFWEVENLYLDYAPAFPNDCCNHKNSRSPSYTGWHDFCINTNLYEFFYNERGHLRMGHPGCWGISKKDADIVTVALENYKRNNKTGLPPGFEDENDVIKDKNIKNYDYNLARLIWLEWWMQWAVKNCETPAIQNY